MPQVQTSPDHCHYKYTDINTKLPIFFQRLENLQSGEILEIAYNCPKTKMENVNEIEQNSSGEM